MRIKFTNATVVDPLHHTQEVKNFYLVNGEIVDPLKMDGKGSVDLTIDSRGKIICPGFVDLGISLDCIGKYNDEKLKKELTALASGGVAYACLTPSREAATDNAAVIENISRQVETLGLSRLLPIGSLTANLDGALISEMFALKNAGAVAVGNGIVPIASNKVLSNAIQYASSCDMPVFYHPEDAYLSDGACAHQGTIAMKHGLASVSPVAEKIAMTRALFLAEQTGVHLHFCRISSAESVKLLQQYKDQGIAVSADVAIANLSFNEEYIDGFNALFHVRPPLRTQQDSKALLQAVQSGVIDAVCSDHRPMTLDGKRAPFAETKPGLATVEVWLPLLLQHVESGDLSLLQALMAITSAPAQICRFSQKYDLAYCKPATLCLIDPELPIEISADRLHSIGENFPRLSHKLKGGVLALWHDGVLVYDSGVIQ